MIVAVGAYYLLNYGNPISNIVMNQKTEEFLMENGYKKEEISKIDSSFDIKRNTARIKGTIAYVTFTDEPNVQYEYIQWRNSREIQQSCDAMNPELKHSDSNCTEKH